MISFATYAISGITKDSTGTPTQKYVAIFERSEFLPLLNTALSDPVTGEYSFTVGDGVTEHFVICFDSTDDPLVDGGSGENAQIYDRVVGVEVLP